VLEYAQLWLSIAQTNCPLLQENLYAIYVSESAVGAFLLVCAQRRWTTACSGHRDLSGKQSGIEFVDSGAADGQRFSVLVFWVKQQVELGIRLDGRHP
jgi:hypothetical protein